MSDLSSQPIKDYKEKYGLEVFIETGTYQGAGIDTAKKEGFSNIWSCEISEKLCNNVRNKFWDDDGVIISNLDSLTFIKELIHYHKRALWWIDDHFPFMYDQSIPDTQETKFPLLEELRIIAQKPGVENDVIICDDMIAIVGSPRWHKGELSDYLQVADIKYEDLLTVFERTHTAIFQEGCEGILTFLPKG
jgi:hypothetical protein